MKFNKKILLLIMLIGVVSLIGAYSASVHDNAVPDAPNTTETDIGCCSIVIQMDGKETLFSHRRDSNKDADVYIEKVNWHGHDAIKQYKNDNGYFCHAIVTSDGWVIGYGGIDDGVNSSKIENITARMINENNTISTKDLEEIQKIKQPYGRGHVLIKAPNGNYGFVTVDQIKTGKLEPGQYISLPNKYEFSRAGNVTLDGQDKIGVMENLSRSDLYGVGRRDIVIYDFQPEGDKSVCDIYVSNEDGFFVKVNNALYRDNIYFNGTLTPARDIPIGPDYKNIGSVTFEGTGDLFSSIFDLIKIIIFVVIAGIVIFVIIRFIRYRRKYY